MYFYVCITLYRKWQLKQHVPNYFTTDSKFRLPSQNIYQCNNQKQTIPRTNNPKFLPLNDNENTTI